EAGRQGSGGARQSERGQAMRRLLLGGLAVALAVSCASSEAFAWGAVRGPAGGAAYRGPMGATAVRGPWGGAAYHGPAGATAYRPPAAAGGYYYGGAPRPYY